jgi:hypothetical protein
LSHGQRPALVVTFHGQMFTCTHWFKESAFLAMFVRCDYRRNKNSAVAKFESCVVTAFYQLQVKYYTFLRFGPSIFLRWMKNQQTKGISRPSRRPLQYTAPTLLYFPRHWAPISAGSCLTPSWRHFKMLKHVVAYWVPIHWVVNSFVGFSFT